MGTFEALHTPEGSPRPPNVSAKLQRDMARLGFLIGQIKEIEEKPRKRVLTGCAIRRFGLQGCAVRRYRRRLAGRHARHAQLSPTRNVSAFPLRVSVISPPITM